MSAIPFILRCETLAVKCGQAVKLARASKRMGRQNCVIYRQVAVYPKILRRRDAECRETVAFIEAVMLQSVLIP